MSSTDKAQWWSIAVAIAVGIGSCVFSYLNLQSAKVQAKAAQEANDRASGKIKAKLEAVGVTPNAEDLPAPLVAKIGQPPERSATPTPDILRQYEREDYQLSERLQPGDQAQVPLLRGLLGQMVQAQDQHRADRKALRSLRDSLLRQDGRRHIRRKRHELRAAYVVYVDTFWVQRCRLSPGSRLSSASGRNHQGQALKFTDTLDQATPPRNRGLTNPYLPKGDR